MSSDRVIFAHDKGGDDSLHLYAVDLKKSETKDLTPVDGVFAELVALSPKRPKEALIGMNDHGKKTRDAYLVDLTTGTRKLVQPNDGAFGAWTGDDDLRVRYATRRNPDASVDMLQPAQGKEKWTVFQHVGPGDALTVTPVGFDATGNTLYLNDSRNRDVSGLFAVDTKTGAATLISDNPKTDVGQVLIHPVKKTVEAVSFDYDRPTWKVVDASVEADFYYLQTFGDGSLVVTSRSSDEQHWLVGYTHDDGPTHYYRYDRDPGHPGQPGEGVVPLQRAGQPGDGEALGGDPRGHQGPRRSRSRQLPDAAHGVGPARRGTARSPLCPWSSGCTTDRPNACRSSTARTNSCSPAAATRCSA